MASKLASLLNGGGGGGGGGSGSGKKDKNKPVTAGSAATVTGAGGETTETYVREDGKTVRRIVRKSGGGHGGGVARAPSSDTLLTTESEIYVRADGKKVRRVRKPGGGSSSSSVSLAPSVAASTTTELGEVFINKDGKKVRRVIKKKTTGGGELSDMASSVTSKTASLGGFLNHNNNNADTENNPNVQVYINEQGKKVRRILKPKAGSAATVIGNTTSSMTEIYVRPDGKKVRRVVKRNTSSASMPALAAAVTKQSPATATTTNEGGEVYINKDGKKVRRVKKSTSSASLPAAATSTTSTSTITPKRRVVRSTSAASTGGSDAEGEIYIRADGKKVRRVRKPKENNASADTAVDDTTKTTTISSTAHNNNKLAGFLDHTKSPATTARGGAATVGGDRKLDGEIIVRPDGKRVIRRVKAAASSSNNTDAANNNNNTTAEGGEVYRRADGKLVRRVKRSSSAKEGTTMMMMSATTTGGGGNSTALPKSATASTTTTTTPLGGARSSTTLFETSGKSATTTTTTGVFPADNVGKESTAASSSLVPKLTDSEEAIATQYRKMKKMGLPDDAVRHKMTVSDVSAKIQAAVLGEDYVEKPVAAVKKSPEPVLSSAALPPMTITTTITPAATAAKNKDDDNELSPEEQNIADLYRKMMQMGLPETAVRHKMVISEIHPKVIAAVFGESMAKSSSPRPSSQLATMTSSSSQSLLEKVATVDLDNNNNGSSNSAADAHLTMDERDRADFFRRMLRMGLPPESVRHKMVVAEVEQKIIDAVLGQPQQQSSTAPPPHPQRGSSLRSSLRSKSHGSSGGGEVDNNDVKPLTAGEEAVADHYRKMIKLGMPDDAVRHKMIVNEVDPRIIAAVCHNNSPGGVKEGAASTQKSSTAEEVSASTNNGAVAFLVIVGDDNDESAYPQSARAAMANAGMDDFALSPDEKFAVKVKEKSTSSSPGDPAQQQQQTTKFLTLDELAKLSGQDKNELQAIVAEKRKRGSSPPRFSLLPLDEQKFEVSVGQKSSALSSASPSIANTPTTTTATLSTAAAAEPGSTTMDHRSKNGKNSGVATQMMQPGIGQEVVDSELAQAARAVASLGDGDMSALLEKLKAGDMKELLSKLHEAEKRQKKLEKQLAQSGIAIAEDIEYSEAKDKVEEIARRMNEIGGSDVTAADKAEQNRLREEYFKLEQEMERYNTALMLTEEYQAEQDRLERKWEDDNEPLNIAALQKLRRHMPVNIRHLSEADLTTRPSPNGKYLPTSIAKKFKRTNVLQCIRLNPDDIECMHPATLENMRVTGLTLTERRALYAHLRSIGPKWKKNKAEKMTERKWTWYQMMKSNFKESVAPYQRHVDQYGPPGPDHKCPLIGKQCPIRADKEFDYDGDYGWTPANEYEVSEVRKADVEDSGAKAMAEARELAKERKANERADILKKHYNGKLLQVSKANGSCESMDESMDNMENNIMRWMEFIMDKGADAQKEPAAFTDAVNEFKLKLLDYAQRSGMQMSGKKKAGGDTLDIRSIVEVSLAEEVYECSQEFFKFIRDRLKELKSVDTRIIKTMEMLEGILNELHQRNETVVKTLGVKRLERSRKLRTLADLQKHVDDRAKAAAAAEEEPVEETPPSSRPGPPAGGGGRGGLLDALAGRGRGGGGGRGGLMDAIAGRGAGRGGGGRGGLMDAIASRGGGGGEGGGGRGGLMDAIAGRGRGGGRGGLMDAIAGRGRGGGPPAGGRGGLMAAIAARGGGDS